MRKLLNNGGWGQHNVLKCYGKEFDNQRILRTQTWIKEQIKYGKNKASLFAKEVRKM